MYPHPTLNSCKGIIRCRDLANCSNIDEIRTNLKSKGVQDVHRIKTKRNGVLKDTNTYILTFDSPVLPDHILIDFQKVKVEPYIPNPLRCFQCQKFGHHVKNCRADAVCANCSEKGHTSENCQNESKCANCGEGHPSFSKQCNIWKKEKEIQRVKMVQNLTFQEARKQVQNSFPKTDKPTYAQTVKASNDSCPTCTIIIEELSKHSPEVADSILEKLNIKKSTSANKPETLKSNSSQESPSAPITISNTSGQTKLSPTETKQTTSNDKQKPKNSSTGKPNSSSSEKPTNLSSEKPTDKQLPKTSTEKKQKLNRYKVNEKSTETVTAALPVSNKFSELQNMDSEMEDMDADESKADWKSLPSWQDDPIPWDESKPG